MPDCQSIATACDCMVETHTIRAVTKQHECQFANSIASDGTQILTEKYHIPVIISIKTVSCINEAYMKCTYERSPSLQGSWHIILQKIKSL